MTMKRLGFLTALTALSSLAATAASLTFTPGRLAVLRIGDGVGDNGGTNKITDWTYKQNPCFIDEFDPTQTGATIPTASVALPTNGANALFLNGNAGTEGGMTRSMDRSAITTTGYNGDILSLSGTPSALPYLRGISVIDAFGSNHLALSRNDWYGFATGKTNPRDVVSDDGTDDFWGAGNVVGTLFYNPALNDGAPQFLQNISDTRRVKIIDGTLYTTVIGKDATNSAYPSGIYNFVDFYDNPSPLPMGFAGFHLVVPAYAQYTNVVGFYLNLEQNVAYMADLAWGVQKYVKAGGQWQFACNYAVQGYEQNGSGPVGIIITNDVKNGFGGCFDVVADFSGTYPVLYATTTDYSIYNGNANSNRIVRIVDTNTVISGVTITNFTVVARTTGTNVGFRTLDFTPDLRPQITSVSGDQSVVAGTPASFSITATESAAAQASGAVQYQWLKNGTTVLTGSTAAGLSFSPVLGDNGSTYQCIASNAYGAVTSTPAIHLTVTSTAVAPYNAGSFQNLTNAVGDNVSITVSAGGTTPLTYQWFAGTTQLSDTGEYSGTATNVLVISGAQVGVDDTNYYCLVGNSQGSSNILVAHLTLVYSKPVFSTLPSSTTVISNSSATFTAEGFGSLLSYEWYSNGVAAVSGNTYTINPARSSVSNIKVVVTNPGGSVTSSPVSLTVIVPPAHGFVNYTNAGQVYTQSFDSLPVVTNVTVNADNPVQVYQVGSSSPIIYSLDNPFDFTYPAVPSGGVGGLNMTNMPGWYGAGSVASHFGAHQGDWTKGGVIDFGTLSSVNPTSGETNRALGLLSTSTSGSSAFGLRLINHSTNTLGSITLSYTGELWRNQTVSNDIVFSYYIDADGTNGFVPSTNTAVAVPSLNVSFNTNAGGILTVDGSQPGNQISLGMTNMAIANWPSNAALWLVWQQLNSQGGAQGLAIDNLRFSASAGVSVTAPKLGAVKLVSPGTLQFSFTNSTGASFTVLGTNNVSAPLANWPVLGQATEVSPGVYQFTDAQAGSHSRWFYIVRSP